MITIWERLISSLLYIIPWSDAVEYGTDIYYNFPITKFLILPALPLILLQNSLPIGNLLLFLILFIGIARNYNLPYFLRLNTMQALLIKIILIIYSYLNILLNQIFGTLKIFTAIESTIFIATLATIIFSCTQCLRGIEPDLPGISNSAKMQI